MELTDDFRQAAFADVFCGRCSKPMAIQRLHYADPVAGFSSIDYNASLAGMRTCSRASLKIQRRQPIRALAFVHSSNPLPATFHSVS